MHHVLGPVFEAKLASVFLQPRERDGARNSGFKNTAQAWCFGRMRRFGGVSQPLKHCTGVEFRVVSERLKRCKGEVFLPWGRFRGAWEPRCRKCLTGIAKLVAVCGCRGSTTGIGSGGAGSAGGPTASNRATSIAPRRRINSPA